MRRGGKAFAVALVLMAGGSARAQEENEEDAEAEADADDDADADAGAKAGEAEGQDARPADQAATTYQGVAPGHGAPVGRRPRHGRTPLVTWLGFQPLPGGAARIFVQIDREVPTAQQIQAGALVISLEGARAAHSNMRRFLDTRFFPTSVERVALEPARRRPGTRRRAPQGLELIVRFKGPAAPRRELAAAMAPAKDGFTYLIVDIPRPTGGAPAARRP